MRTHWLLVALTGVTLTTELGEASAMPTQAVHAGALHVRLERLLTTGRVLYVAAHPDDENTRLLAYLANKRHFDTAYLSITRGGGGQNLIGPEQAELLGVIRTQELLAARRLDGGLQRCTNARDFGYCKTPDEALRIWGHEATLADVVWVIRTFMPDVVITRFADSGSNHGHHTASAILARQAFDAAADPNRFAEQLERGAQPFEPQRLLLNVPSWGRDQSELAGYMAVDVGDYDARLGLSYGELAAQSTSMHKSQGFGSRGRRGPQPEYFQQLAGSAANKAPFDNLELGWERFDGARAIVAHLRAAKRQLDIEHPERMVPALLKAYDAIEAVHRRRPDARLRKKLEDLTELVAAALGLFVQARAELPEAAPGSKVPLTLEVILRRPAELVLAQVLWPHRIATVDRPLAADRPLELSETVSLPEDVAVSTPYWLTQEPSKGRYQPAQPLLTGEPEGPPALSVTAVLALGGRKLQLVRPVMHRVTDPVHGERQRRFIITPPATVTPAKTQVMFKNGETRVVSLMARAGQEALLARVRLRAPAGWRIVPAFQPLTLAHAGEQTVVAFEVTPPPQARDATQAHPRVVVGATESGYRLDVIDYGHIPVQAVLQTARMRFVPLELALPRARVGYVMGSGDTVAEDLRHVGIEVEELDDATLRHGDLSRYGAIVLGIRAHNTRAALAAAQPRLMQWVHQGGTLVAQYNVSNRWEPLERAIGPYPFTIDRGRVTDESAPMVAVDPSHPILKVPNRLEASDFDGWVQERGLYFASTWDQRYQSVFRLQDAGEEPQQGALIVARHGKGAFIYTGLSFFRQLPAGVPGAYRLFANILAFGQKL